MGSPPGGAPVPGSGRPGGPGPGPDVLRERGARRHRRPGPHGDPAEAAVAGRAGPGRGCNRRLRLAGDLAKLDMGPVRAAARRGLHGGNAGPTARLIEPQPGSRRQREESAMKGPLISEIRQSFYLMGLMAAIVASYVGLGLLAVRVLG